MLYYNQEIRKEEFEMRICVTYWNGETNRARFFKTIDEAKNFIWVCRKMRPEYSDFKIKVIKP